MGKPENAPDDVKVDGKAKAAEVIRDLDPPLGEMPMVQIDLHLPLEPLE